MSLLTSLHTLLFSYFNLFSDFFFFFFTKFSFSWQSFFLHGLLTQWREQWRIEEGGKLAQCRKRLASEKTDAHPSADE